ncbi:GPP34 family phosphoprotein [Saccharopolyspora shandongensis]|uniref:GPP34 family phosphoprotein n=1 Tax=Saccharopolyspora shandongensis TaxID=418495 RepID=UPI0033E67307
MPPSHHQNTGCGPASDMVRGRAVRLAPSGRCEPGPARFWHGRARGPAIAPFPARGIRPARAPRQRHGARLQPSRGRLRRSRTRSSQLAGPDPEDQEVRLRRLLPVGCRDPVADASSTGLGWADALLAELAQGSATDCGSVRLRHWLRRRHRTASALHRSALVERGLLRRDPGEGFAGIFRGERHRPDLAACCSPRSSPPSARTGTTSACCCCATSPSPPTWSWESGRPFARAWTADAASVRWRRFPKNCATPAWRSAVPMSSQGG